MILLDLLDFDLVDETGLFQQSPEVLLVRVKQNGIIRGKVSFTARVNCRGTPCVCSWV